MKAHTALTLALTLCGLTMLAQAAWIPMKARLAHSLLETAATKAAESQQPEKPWAWADFGVIGTLHIKGRNIPILSNATGQALAFGAGRHEEVRADGPPVISGHRDTHFSVLGYMKEGDRFSYNLYGTKHDYKVVDTRIYDIREGTLLTPDTNQILLITCWPFSGVDPNTPKRFLLLGEKI